MNEKIPPVKNEPQPDSYGGFSTREAYERSRRGKRKNLPLTIAKGIVTALLIGFAAFGAFTLIREGIASPPATEVPGNGGSIQLPEQTDATTKAPEKLLEQLSNVQLTFAARFSDGTIRYGSGFLLTEQGTAVCSAELIQSDRLHVSTACYAAGSARYQAELIGTNEALGIAYFSLRDENGFAELPTKDSEIVYRGETLYISGSVKKPLYYGTTLSGPAASIQDAVTVGTGSDAVTLSLIYVAVPPNPTLYGAPVMNSDGLVVGFCTGAIDAPYEGLSVVIPIQSVFLAMNSVLVP